MTDSPSQEALEAAREIRKHAWARTTVVEWPDEASRMAHFALMMQEEAAIALDRFRAAERERLQAIIHSLCPDAKNNWCRGGMLYGSDGKAMGACEWPGHIAGGHT